MSLNLKSSGGGSVTVDVPSTASDYTATLPAANITVVGTDTTQTLTNKTLSGAVMSNMASSVITSGTAVSASGTSVNFTGIPSWVKRITVMFSGVSTNGTSAILVQLGDSGGIENTGYVSGSFNDTGSANLTSTAGLLANHASVAASAYNGQMIISLLGSNNYVETSYVFRSGTTGSSAGGGTKTLSDTLDRIRITTVNGTDTFDAGSINILYE